MPKPSHILLVALFAVINTALPLPAFAMSCLFQTEHSHAGSNFRVYYEDHCSIPNRDLSQPLIVFAPGDGFLPADYDAFMAALVEQGNVVVSIYANLQSNEIRAERMLAAIDYVKNIWTHKQRLTDEIAFIGHSRGGEAVLTAARANFEQNGMPASAVISLMGTDSQKGGGEAEYLVSPIGEAYLAIVAGRDEDVTGLCFPMILGCKNAIRNSASLYDRVGREWGTWDVGDYLIDRSVKLLPGFSHAAWFNESTENSQNEKIGIPPSVQRKVIHDYVVRFLDWRFNGNEDQHAYFDGTMETDLIIGVINQYVQHSTPNLVIDTFQNSKIQDSDLGKKLVKLSGSAVFLEEDISLLDPTVPNDSDGLMIQWQNLSPSVINWSFPPEENVYQIPTIKASDFPFLSLRAVQVYSSRLNNDVAVKARVRLVDVRNRSSEVIIGTDTPFTIPRAEIQHYIPAQFGKTSTLTNMMRTLRIPLSTFANVDLSAIRSISIIVGMDSQRGAIIVDSIEFTH